MNKNEPLGLPRGSVRAILTFGLVALLGVCLFVPTVDGAEQIAAGLLALAVMAVKDYFSARAEADAQGPGLADPVINE